MQNYTYEIKDEMGLHARPAGELVKAARGYKSKIILSVNGKSAEATRLIAVMGLCARKGSVLSVSIEGEDEVSCAEDMRKFFSENL